VRPRAQGGHSLRQLLKVLVLPPVAFTAITVATARVPGSPP